jgi:hypothetical protein
VIADLLKDTILSYAHDLKPSSNGWLKCDCPMCLTMGETKDTRGRFGITFSHDGSFGMNCFNCHYMIRWNVGSALSQKLISYFEMIGVPEHDIRELKFAAYREKENILTNQLPEISQVVRRTWKETELPEGSRSLNKWLSDECDDQDFISVCSYAIKRKIYDFDNVYWAKSSTNQLKKRLLFPFTNYGKIVGYTGRFIGENKSIPKYYNKMPDNFVYNLDEQTYDRKYCILCEGIIDAHLTSGIACLGNTINDKQVEVINSLKKTVILVPDRDNSGENTIKVAINNGWLVSFPKWGDDIKDSADAVEKYGKLLTVKSILNSVEHNPLKIHVARKFDNYKGR